MVERAAQAELICCLVAILCGLAAGVTLIVRREHAVRDAAATALAILAIAMLRGAVTRFSLVHANFHAVETLDEVYARPLQSTRGYGVFNSLFYGGVMRLSGADFGAVAWANEIVAAATLLLMGFLGARYASSRSAFGLVVGLGLMHPVLLRLAGSEEGHNLSVLMSFIALAALEAYRTTPRRAYLIVSAAALVLMLTKGIMLASIPCIAGIALVRAGDARQRRAVLWSLLPVVAMILVRLPDWAQQQGMYRLSQRLSLDSAIIAFHTHPLLDPRGPVCLIAPLLLVGMFVLLRRSWRTRIVVASLAFLFASSFLIFEGQPVVFTFRLPVLTLAIVVAGVGAAMLVDRASARWAGPSFTRGPELVAACLVALTILAPGFDIVRAISAQTGEYEFIRSVTDRLPRSFTLIRLPEGIPHPSYVFPHHLLERAGISAPVGIYPAALHAGTGQPRVFLAGLECWGYSFLELTAPPDPATWQTVTYGPTYGEFLRTPGTVIPSVERAECQEMRRRGARVVAGREIATPSHADAPFVYYAADTTRLEFLLLPP